MKQYQFKNLPPGLETDQVLIEGVILFNQQMYWQAHEVWEKNWRRLKPTEEAVFYKGLIHIAAGCLHYIRKNPKGAIAKWQSGLKYISKFGPNHMAIDLNLITNQINEMILLLNQSLAEGYWPAIPKPYIGLNACNGTEGRATK